MAEPFVKIYKKMLDWEWYDDINTKVLFLHCLLKANWQAGSWHGIRYEPGQFITSLPTLAEETKLSIHQVRVALEHLKMTGEVADKGHSKYRMITINNWSQYQSGGRQVADKRQTSGRQVASDKEYKELKELKNKYYKDDRLDSAFADYVLMRKDIKKPMTDRAIELAIKKLDKLSGGNTDAAIEIINQSIMGGWQGRYPLKGKSDPAANMGGTTRKYTSDYFAELEADAINQWN